ncbi:hypothetical protein Gotur_027107, partial [Gossypium turneri]
MSNVWNQIHRIKRLAVDPMTTSEYNEWWVRRINDNISKQIQGNNQSIEENLWVVSSELEIIRQDFERRNAELEKKIEQMEEDKINLRLDIDVQKLEVEKLRNGKNKAKEDLDSLKINYKKLRLLMRIVGLGKTSEHGVKRFEKKRIRLIDGKGNIKRNMMTQLTQLLAGGNGKGKGPMANIEEGDNEGPVYPSGFTPPHVQTQAEVYPRKSSVTRSCKKTRNYCEFYHEEGYEILEYIEFRALVQGMMDDKEVDFYEEVKEEGSICASESMTKVSKVNHHVVIISRPKNNEAGVSV